MGRPPLQVLASIALLCCWQSAPGLTLAWLTVYWAAAAGTVAWLWLRPAAFAVWREVPAALLGLFRWVGQAPCLLSFQEGCLSIGRQHCMQEVTLASPRIQSVV